MIAVLLLGACAAGAGIAPEFGATSTTVRIDSSSTVSTVAASRYGGTVVVGVGIGGSPRTLNPLIEGPDTEVLDLIAPAVFAMGYRVDPVTLALAPHALAAIPSLDNGGVVDNGDGTIDVVVSLAAEARWGDGTPMTAADLEYTYRLVVDPALPIRPELVSRYSKIDPDSVVAEGKTLSFRMQATTEYELLFDLIVPRHAVAGSDFESDWTDTLWVSGGPFSLATWRPGQYLELIRNEAYWKRSPAGEPLPYLDRVIFRFYDPGPDPDPRLVDAFESGDVDVVAIGEAARSAEAFRVDGAVVEVGPGLLWDHLNFQFGPGNRNAESLNRHLDFRRAIAHAIDRTTLSVETGGGPLSSALRLYGSSFTDSPWSRYEYDLDEVRNLLFKLETAIGRDLFAGDGPRVVLTVASERSAELAGTLVTMLREAGFDAELQLEESTLFFGTTVDNGSWDVSSWRFGGGPGLGSAEAFIAMFDPDGLPFVGANFYRWGTIDSTVSGRPVEDYRDLVDALGQTVDPAEVTALLEEAEGILADQVVIIPLLVSDEIGIARREGLTGPGLNRVMGVAWNIDEWTLGE